MQSQDLRLFITQEHACGYFPDRQARNLLLDPQNARIFDHYHRALGAGFRRSGALVYRPACRDCTACVPVRIDVEQFKASRNLQRVRRRAGAVTSAFAKAVCDDEHFDLYRHYLQHRHAGGGMDDPKPEDFERYLGSGSDRTEFLDFRIDGRLVAVAVTDRVPEALSAVYTFFDPALAHLSLGTLAILRQFDAARAEGLRWLYLGYFIDGHPKMHYKSRFPALEALEGKRWQPRPQSTQAS